MSQIFVCRCGWSGSEPVNRATISLIDKRRVSGQVPTCPTCGFLLREPRTRAQIWLEKIQAVWSWVRGRVRRKKFIPGDTYQDIMCEGYGHMWDEYPVSEEEKWEEADKKLATALDYIENYKVKLSDALDGTGQCKGRDLAQEFESFHTHLYDCWEKSKQYREDYWQKKPLSKEAKERMVNNPLVNRKKEKRPGPQRTSNLIIQGYEGQKETQNV